MGDARIDNRLPGPQQDQGGECSGEIALDWLPIEQAQFYFLPKWTGKGQSWRDAVARIFGSSWCRDAVDWEVLERLSEDEDELRIRVGNVRLIIEVPTAEIGLMSMANPDIEADWGEIIVENGVSSFCSPDKFLKHFSVARIKPEYAASALNAIRLAQSLIDDFLVGFDIALRNGDAIIFARVNSPLSAFEHIKFDQWRYFRKRGTGTAEGPHGEKLYSIHIKPKLAEKSLELVKKSEVSLAELQLDIKDDCISWLRRHMEASPDRATATKDCFYAKALEQWPDLSKRAFCRTWDFAIQQTGASGWSRPGPRRNRNGRNPDTNLNRDG